MQYIIFKYQRVKENSLSTMAENSKTYIKTTYDYILKDHDSVFKNNYNLNM